MRRGERATAPTLTILLTLSSVPSALALARPSLVPFGLPSIGSVGTENQIIIGLAVVAVVAGVVAVAAYVRDPARRASRRRVDLAEYAATALPDTSGTRSASDDVPPHLAYATPGLPRWIQLASVAVAVAVTWFVAERILPSMAGSRDPTVATVIDDAEAPATGDAALVADVRETTFAFRALEWVDTGEGCAGTMEATRPSASPRRLTMTVRDERGRILDTAHARVDSVRLGDIVEFEFARASCDRISAWEVRGEAAP